MSTNPSNVSTSSLNNDDLVDVSSEDETPVNLASTIEHMISKYQLTNTDHNCNNENEPQQTD